MQLELFSFTELCNCALVTARNAFKSNDFSLWSKMMDSVSLFSNEQSRLLRCTRGRKYWQN